MGYNLGILFPLFFVSSLVGVIVGIIKKNKKLRNISLIIMGIILIAFIVLEMFVFE